MDETVVAECLPIVFRDYSAWCGIACEMLDVLQHRGVSKVR
ncbi:MAG: hypothetical protein ACPLSM_03495 [Thermosphaera sp.]|nr:hypothetical protein [Thermosphaera aggregans]